MMGTSSLPAFASGKAFGTGLIALDIVLSAEAGSTPQAWAGGTCGNVMAILAFLGWEAHPVARLNGDPASIHVKSDFERAGVKLDYVACAPTANTPIIVQEIRKDRHGHPRHRFSWVCPSCGAGLPTYRAVTLKAAADVGPALQNADVFFLDRVSAAGVWLAGEAKAAGAMVVFEPSAKGDERLVRQTLALADVVKYADQRFQSLDLDDAVAPDLKLEIQTMGAKGLRYRRSAHDTWDVLPALKPIRSADTCGSGDWFTGSLVAQLGGGGTAALEALSDHQLRDRLEWSTAVAAWNCGFEGARGGMYASSLPAMLEDIQCIRAGRSDEAAGEASTPIAPRLATICPSCEPGGNTARS